MIDVINKAIYTALNGNSGVTSKLAAATSIFFGLAPVGTALPYIVYSIAGGGSDNDTPLDSVDLRYTIKAVTETAVATGALAGAIRTALHEATLTLDAPWSAYRCQHQTDIMYPENVDRLILWHGGGTYRIRASK
jgi:hypothetical protein